ncbi:MAG: WD40/YVTN/BNR-like repeat-containing protein [Limisphaerales bacterium]
MLDTLLSRIGSRKLLTPICLSLSAFAPTALPDTRADVPEDNPVRLPWSTTSGPNFNRITYDDGIFVAVGAGGHLATSPTGLVWTLRNTGTLANLRSVIRGHDGWLAAGDDGVLLFAPDAKTWSLVDSGITETIHDIVYSRCLYVAVGASGALFTSHDGIRWSRKRSGTSNELRRVIDLGNSFFAAGAQGAVVRSKDASRWYPFRLAERFGISDLFQSSEETIALGCCGGGVLVGGIHGVWEPQNLPGSPLLRAGAVADSTIVVVGVQGAIFTTTATPGSKMWIRCPSGTTRTLNDIAWGRGRWVTVGSGGIVLVSDDSRVWRALPGSDPTPSHPPQRTTIPAAANR